MKTIFKGISICLVMLFMTTACQMGTTPEEVITNPEQATINKLMETAEQNFKDEKYEDTITKTKEILALDDKYVPAYLLMARGYMKQDDLVKTKATLDAVDQVKEQTVTAQYYEVYAEYQTKTRKYTEALQSIDKAINLESSNGRLALKGSIQYYLHQHQEAKAALNAAIKDETDAERNTYYYLLTELAIYEQDFPTALKYIETLKTITVDDSRIYAMEGYIYYLQSDSATNAEQKQKLRAQGDMALNQAKEKLTLQPAAVTYNYLGLSTYISNDYAQAETYYTQAIELDPYYASFYNNRALVHYYSYDYESAYKDASKAIELDKLEPEFYLGRGYILMSQEQSNAAIADFTKAVELDKTYLERIPEEMIDALPSKLKETN